MIAEDQEIIDFRLRNKMTYFIFKSNKMPVHKYIKILIAFLTLMMFIERYTFAVAVYKMKNYGYILIVLVIFLNTMFLGLIQKLRKTKQKKRMHELYNIDRAPQVGFCIIGFCGCLDMIKSFCLFWPANALPIWLLISLMQLFIPLNMLLRACCIEEV